MSLGEFLGQIPEGESDTTVVYKSILREFVDCKAAPTICLSTVKQRQRYALPCFSPVYCKIMKAGRSNEAKDLLRGAFAHLRITRIQSCGCRRCLRLSPNRPQGICGTSVVFTDCETCTRSISTNPGSMEAGEYGLTRGTCSVTCRLEVAAVAELLWISWHVLVAAGFGVFHAHSITNS